MKKFTKRSLAWLASVMLLISLLASLIVVPTQAATVNYVTSGNYVYNWGERDELATFLSPMAEDFYDANNVTYTQLASLSGSSTTSSVPSSSLFSELHELMYGNLDNPTSYDATRDLFQYTDCENSGGSISAFYSGKAIGPAWDSGKTWNREHVWPNSKSNGGSNSNTQRETDIMMLRPASVSENSSRSNTAYGEGAKYYDPNELGQNVRGDAARTVLYVYVCWGGSSAHDGALDYMWGSSGVMESKDILLKWIEEDPVDTWELGRNDSVESITGTRNVFVDYPELAFLLFNEDVPDDYDSPSGEGASGGCAHNYVGRVTTAATCGKDGVKTYTCSLCGDSYTEVIPATGAHTYDNACDADCNACGTARTPAKHIYTAACDTTCDVCGAVRTVTAGGETTITFDADKTQRIEFSTAAQVWQNGDLIVTNNKGSATSNVADYSAPVRFYKGSQIIIAYPGMTSLVINAPTGQYGTPWAATMDNAGLTYTVDGGVYTVTFTTPVDSITLTASAQIRANSITAIGSASIDHVYDNDNDATCNVCGAIRQIAAQVMSGGKTSVSEDVNGLAFFFTANVSGAQTQNGYEYVTNSASVIPFVDGESYSVVRMGAVVSNGVSSVDIEAKYLWETAANEASFAVRLINIPDSQLDCVITARPYYVYEVDGEEIVVYGDTVSKTYNQAAL
ncbi:MAG: endonuclease [Clostridia bacterium]|nr:endonuclease [Clostridia bacterium]